jgi:predicted transcriptional regulator
MATPGRSKDTSDEEILRAIALHSDKAVTSSEIAEQVDMTSAGVNKRLRDLAESGDIVRKEVGARAVVYWVTDQGRERASDA